MATTACSPGCARPLADSPGAVAVRAAAAAQVFVGDLGVPEPTAPDAHHLARVLRLRAGEVVVAADGAGSWRPCRYADGGRLDADGDICTEARAEPAITVGFAPVKGDRPEWVVQKLTEVGADRIVVLATERSVVRWEGERARRALSRLERTAKEASAQCRRVWLPELSGPLPLAEALALAPFSLAHLGGDAPTLERPAVAVGPEGGWSPAELALGAPLVGLGPSVLRAETAALAAGVVLASLRAETVHPA